MKNVAYDYKSVDDNIQYLNKCGANHHLGSGITPKVSSLGAETTVISEGAHQ